MIVTREGSIVLTLLEIAIGLPGADRLDRVTDSGEYQPGRSGSAETTPVPAEASPHTVWALTSPTSFCGGGNRVVKWPGAIL